MPDEASVQETMESLTELLRGNDWQCPGDVFVKQGRDIVTDTDMSLQRRIIEVIRERFPDHNILAEEAEYERTPSPFTWVIDPVDGTINFSRNYPVFAVSVALVEGETPVSGIVYVPPFQKIYSAVRGKGAFCNGSALHCGSVSRLQDSLISVILTSHFNAGENSRAAAIIERANMRTRGVRVMVCESAELCLIAEGILDGNVSVKADPYGAMAGKLILEEAGGHFSQICGAPFGLFSDTILASNGYLHESLRELCAPWATGTSQWHRAVSAMDET